MPFQLIKPDSCQKMLETSLLPKKGRFCPEALVGAGMLAFFYLCLSLQTVNLSNMSECNYILYYMQA